MAEKKKGKALKIVLIVFGVIVVSNVITLISGMGKEKTADTATAPEEQATTQEVKSEPPAQPAQAQAPAPNPEDDPNYTGFWAIGNFNDAFGDKTGDKFILTLAKGTFSNSAVKDEKLRVHFIITKENFVMEMYEDYWGMENDVATTFIIMDSASVLVRDKDGTDYRLRGRTNGTSGQRLYVIPFADIIRAVNKGGTVRFSINVDNMSTYRFDIPNADYFDRAFSQIGGKITGAAPASPPKALGYQQMGKEDTW
jgi:hypothetical protein